MTTTLERSTPDLSLKAVHDDDLEAYLLKLGVRGVGGVLGTCKFCGHPVTHDNLATIFPQSGSLKLACDRPDCLKGVQDLISEGRISL